MAQVQEVRVPDIGDFDDVSVIEVLVAAGDRVDIDQSLITLESDKASMEVPSPHAGTVREIKVSVGDSIAEGGVIAILETDEPKAAAASDAPSPDDTRAPDEKVGAAGDSTLALDARDKDARRRDAGAAAPPSAGPSPYASPSVRRLAREQGIDLSAVAGSGRKGRITREDVLAPDSGVRTQQAPKTGPGMLPPMPVIDFSQFGEIEELPLSRIRQRAASNLHRSWLHVPHVTQHEDADITEMEAFRKAHNRRVVERGEGSKLSPVAFALKAVARALRAFPDVNASLGDSGDTLIRKRYMHIGVAVDTQDGLVVPVIRDVEHKGLEALAGELAAMAKRARDRKLTPGDLKGACFTISSLGGIGGTAFTPIVNAPEVAILGLSRANLRPVWQGEGFVPRLMLPLSLSYDHRVVDGALAARFVVYLSDCLSDLRRLLL